MTKLIMLLVCLCALSLTACQSSIDAGQVSLINKEHQTFYENGKKITITIKVPSSKPVVVIKEHK